MSRLPNADCGLPLVLMQLRMTAAEVRALTERARPLSPDEVRRAAARAVRKMSCGRGGLPAHAVDAMYRDYLDGKSLAATGKIYGRTRQTMYAIFRSRGKKLRHKKFFKKVVWCGRAYTPGKDNYLRATSGDRKALDVAVWEAAHGPVPAGNLLTFVDGDNQNVTLGNLLCAARAEVMHKTRCGHNQFTPRGQFVKRHRLRPHCANPQSAIANPQ